MSRDDIHSQSLRHDESAGQAMHTLQELRNFKFALDESVIVAITDTAGVITYVNDTFCEISKYPREELIGNTHQLVNSGHHSPRFFAAMWITISSGKVWRGKIKNKAKDGSFYWVDTTIVPFLDEQTQRPYQYIAIRKDITYLKRVENELRLLNEGLEERVTERTAELAALNTELSEALERLQESDRVRETFVTALTHDLRTPLIAEQRVLELIQAQEHLLPPKFKDITGRLLKNNDDLLSLVNKLLEIYQYEAGRVLLCVEPVNLFELVDSSVEALLPLADEKQIVLKNQIPVDIDLIEVDAVQLRRVFSNLVHNAIRHLKAGDRITITASCSQDIFHIRVEDNGPGIPKDILPNLFDRYFAAQQARKKIGSGLGLSICKMIIKLHKGTIMVNSSPGEGTQFLLTLPKSQDLSR